MINIAQMALVLHSLPDPAFVITQSGRYIAVLVVKMSVITTMEVD